MPLPSYAGRLETIWYYIFRVICGCVLFFLIAPIVVLIPLSFNAEPYFTFTHGMLTLKSSAFSTRWYQDIINNPQWIHSIKNSVIIGFFATIFATFFGTLAAWGLSRPQTPFWVPLMGLLISPMIVPLIITAAGMFFFYSKIGLAQTYPGLIIAHTALGIPFVIITVTATLMGFDQDLIRASASLGCQPGNHLSQSRNALDTAGRHIRCAFCTGDFF